MANKKVDSPRAFLIYETTLQQLKKYCTPAQAGEFLFLMGAYMLEGQTDVESNDPMVDVILQMNKPVLRAPDYYIWYSNLLLPRFMDCYRIIQKVLHVLLSVPYLITTTILSVAEITFITELS